MTRGGAGALRVGVARVGLGHSGVASQGCTDIGTAHVNRRACRLIVPLHTSTVSVVVARLAGAAVLVGPNVDAVGVGSADMIIVIAAVDRVADANFVDGTNGLDSRAVARFACTLAVSGIRVRAVCVRMAAAITRGAAENSFAIDAIA